LSEIFDTISAFVIFVIFIYEYSSSYLWAQRYKLNI
jgi:hypothetical protein